MEAVSRRGNLNWNDSDYTDISAEDDISGYHSEADKRFQFPGI
jgi:hypothetical protein